MNKFAEDYDRVQRDYQGKDGKELIDKLTLKEGCSVLDLGCGTGYLTSLLGERVGQRGTVTGVDPDATRIAVARRNHGELKNVTFLEGSSEDFPSGPYDLVFSNHVINWIEDKRNAFRNVFKSLKDGGTFAFICPTKTEEAAESSNRLWSLVHPAFRQHSHVLDSNTYLKLAIDCGFKVKFLAVEPVKYTFVDIAAYFDYLIPTLTTDATTPDLDVINQVKKQFVDCKPVHMDWTKAVIIMNK